MGPLNNIIKADALAQHIRSESMSRSRRIVEIDVLRVIAIVAIVVSHLHFSIPSFQESSTILMAESFIATIGLTLFFLLSGYSLMLKRPEFRTASDLRTFFKKRLLRIYPLYWLAIGFTLLMHSYGFTSGWVTNMDVGQLVLTLLGLQIIFSSTFTLVPFWFVSAIVVFYLLFPLLIYVSGRMRFSFTLSVTAVSAVIFAILLAISAITDEIDDRLLIYFWFFIAGIVLGREVDIPSITWSRSLPWIVISAIVLPFTEPKVLPSPLKEQVVAVLPQYLSDFLSVVLVGIIGILVMVQVAKWYRAHLWARTSRVMMWIAPRTLSIYMFSGALVLLAASLGESISPSLVPIVAIVVGVPLALLVPPLVQVAVDRGVDLLAGRAKT